ncbi:hypothetical protein HDU93_003786 [Gonapodya sp. JEL0774]|nr:hypothetical protein HDU93_003786 [Gonapodya sp. JEL0774]
MAALGARERALDPEGKSVEGVDANPVGKVSDRVRMFQPPGQPGFSRPTGQAAVAARVIGSNPVPGKPMTQGFRGQSPNIGASSPSALSIGNLVPGSTGSSAVTIGQPRMPVGAVPPSIGYSTMPPTNGTTAISGFAPGVGMGMGTGPASSSGPMGPRDDQEQRSRPIVVSPDTRKDTGPTRTQAHSDEEHEEVEESDESSEEEGSEEGSEKSESESEGHASDGVTDGETEGETEGETDGESQSASVKRSHIEDEDDQDEDDDEDEEEEEHDSERDEGVARRAQSSHEGNEDDDDDENDDDEEDDDEEDEDGSGSDEEGDGEEQSTDQEGSEEEGSIDEGSEEDASVDENQYNPAPPRGQQPSQQGYAPQLPSLRPTHLDVTPTTTNTPPASRSASPTSQLVSSIWAAAASGDVPPAALPRMPAGSQTLTPQQQQGSLLPKQTSPVQPSNLKSSQQPQQPTGGINANGQVEYSSQSSIATRQSMMSATAAPMSPPNSSPSDSGSNRSNDRPRKPNQSGEGPCSLPCLVATLYQFPTASSPSPTPLTFPTTQPPVGPNAHSVDSPSPQYPQPPVTEPLSRELPNGRPTGPRQVALSPSPTPGRSVTPPDAGYTPDNGTQWALPDVSSLGSMERKAAFPQLQQQQYQQQGQTVTQSGNLPKPEPSQRQADKERERERERAERERGERIERERERERENGRDVARERDMGRGPVNQQYQQGRPDARQGPQSMQQQYQQTQQDQQQRQGLGPGPQSSRMSQPAAMQMGRGVPSTQQQSPQRLPQSGSSNQQYPSRNGPQPSQMQTPSRQAGPPGVGQGGPNQMQQQQQQQQQQMQQQQQQMQQQMQQQQQQQMMQQQQQQQQMQQQYQQSQQGQGISKEQPTLQTAPPSQSAGSRAPSTFPPPYHPSLPLLVYRHPALATTDHRSGPNTVGAFVSLLKGDELWVLESVWDWHSEESREEREMSREKRRQKYIKAGQSVPADLSEPEEPPEAELMDLLTAGEYNETKSEGWLLVETAVGKRGWVPDGKVKLLHNPNFQAKRPRLKNPPPPPSFYLPDGQRASTVGPPVPTPRTRSTSPPPASRRLTISAPKLVDPMSLPPEMRAQVEAIRRAAGLPASGGGAKQVGLIPIKDIERDRERQQDRQYDDREGAAKRKPNDKRSEARTEPRPQSQAQQQTKDDEEWEDVEPTPNQSKRRTNEKNRESQRELPTSSDRLETRERSDQRDRVDPRERGDPRERVDPRERIERERVEEGGGLMKKRPSQRRHTQIELQSEAREKQEAVTPKRRASGRRSEVPEGAEQQHRRRVLLAVGSGTSRYAQPNGSLRVLVKVEAKEREGVYLVTVAAGSGQPTMVARTPRHMQLLSAYLRARLPFLILPAPPAIASGSQSQLSRRNVADPHLASRWERYLNRVASHPVVVEDPDVARWMTDPDENALETIVMLATEEESSRRAVDPARAAERWVRHRGAVQGDPHRAEPPRSAVERIATALGTLPILQQAHKFAFRGLAEAAARLALAYDESAGGMAIAGGGEDGATAMAPAVEAAAGAAEYFRAAAGRAADVESDESLVELSAELSRGLEQANSMCGWWERADVSADAKVEAAAEVAYFEGWAWSEVGRVSREGVGSWVGVAGGMRSM